MRSIPAYEKEYQELFENYEKILENYQLGHHNPRIDELISLIYDEFDHISGIIDYADRDTDENFVFRSAQIKVVHGLEHIKSMILEIISLSTEE